MKNPSETEIDEVKQEEYQKDESMWNIIKTSMTDYPKNVGIIFTIVGIILLWITGIITFLINLTNENISSISILISISLGLISIGIAVISIGLSMKSDEKMKALSELSFVEKIAMMYEYINNMEGLKIKNVVVFPSSTPDQKTIPNDELKKIIQDLDSALKVINYIGEETRNKFLSYLFS